MRYFGKEKGQKVLEKYVKIGMKIPELKEFLKISDGRGEIVTISILKSQKPRGG